MAKELNVLLMEIEAETIRGMEAEAQNILFVKRNSKTEEMEVKADGN